MTVDYMPHNHDRTALAGRAARWSNRPQLPAATCSRIDWRHTGLQLACTIHRDRFPVGGTCPTQPESNNQ